MNLLRLGPSLILRPSRSAIAAIRASARKHLFSSFSMGNYSDPRTVNAIIQHQFNFYDNKLRELIPNLASRHAVEFLLYQYDQAQSIFRGGKIDDEMLKQDWIEVEGLFRRAIKYMVELMCKCRPGVAPRMSNQEAAFSTEICLALAEEALHLAEVSHRAFSLFPNDWTVWIHAQPSDHDFDLRIAGRHESFDVIFFDRVARDRAKRSQYLTGQQFDIHTRTHASFLDGAFTQSFGMSYQDFIAVISRTISQCHPAPKSFPTLFVQRQSVIDAMTEACGKPRAAVELAIQGFTVDPNHLEAENRIAYRPKQESRAYRRGFFAFPYETGLHLAFSREMAKECLIFSVNRVCYRSLPSEWKSQDTSTALVKLSTAAGQWFEGMVASNLRSLGIVGQRSKGKIKDGDTFLRIPSEVGELDFLGYNPVDNALVLIEAKMVLTGLEAPYWRDDIDQFVLSKKSFAVQFRKKASWVANSFASISAALGANSASKLHVAMITIYPCIATEMIDDFPCRSLTEFMLDYQKAGHWPYPEFISSKV